MTQKEKALSWGATGQSHKEVIGASYHADRAASALWAIPCPPEREPWWRILGSAIAEGIHERELMAWCEAGPNFDRVSAKATIRSLGRRRGGGSGSLFKLARACGWRDGPHTHKAPARPHAARAKPLRRGLAHWARKTWEQCQPIGGIAADYSHARCCAVPPADGALRWHPALRHLSGYRGPALVALVTDAATGEPLSLHRTWITATGKADLTPAKAYLKGHDLAGGVIRLWPDELVTYGLAIAEGIETALSLAHAFWPVWALMDAGHMERFAPLAGIDALTIAADNDAAGRKAAAACAVAWSAAGAEVVIQVSSLGDMNDEAVWGVA